MHDGDDTLARWQVAGDTSIVSPLITLTVASSLRLASMAEATRFVQSAIWILR